MAFFASSPPSAVVSGTPASGALPPSEITYRRSELMTPYMG
ncbi:hypothetical protein OK016_13840 [Vibrio chagasii]|nr:hypothetical protein [Vibrio chagasii]